MEALAAFLFEELDPAFGERAKAAGGGALVAGARFGRPGRADAEAALALAAAGVRLVLARSFEPRFQRQLADAGVLPLRTSGAVARAGDELEFPGVPEQLESARPVAVRNLTRGSESLAEHDLAEARLERARLGGWAYVAARAPERR